MFCMVSLEGRRLLWFQFGSPSWRPKNTYIKFFFKKMWFFYLTEFIFYFLHDKSWFGTSSGPESSKPGSGSGFIKYGSPTQGEAQQLTPCDAPLMKKRLTQSGVYSSDLTRRFRILRSVQGCASQNKDIRVLLHRHPKIQLKQKTRIGEPMGKAINKPFYGRHLVFRIKIRWDSLSYLCSAAIKLIKKIKLDLATNSI